MNFVDSVVSFWKKSFDYKGVTSRSEYWYATLHIFMLSLMICVFVLSYSMDFFLANANSISTILSVIFLIPATALEIRRLRDVGLPPAFVIFNLSLEIISYFSKNPNITRTNYIVSIIFIIFALLPSKEK